MLCHDLLNYSLYLRIFDVPTMCDQISNLFVCVAMAKSSKVPGCGFVNTKQTSVGAAGITVKTYISAYLMTQPKCSYQYKSKYE